MRRLILLCALALSTAPAAAGGLSAPVVEPGRVAGACAPSPLARTATLPPVPRGYARAVEDGRLNPLRGPRTVCGDQQMAQAWNTARVPMRRN